MSDERRRDSHARRDVPQFNHRVSTGSGRRDELAVRTEGCVVDRLLLSRHRVLLFNLLPDRPTACYVEKAGVQAVDGEKQVIVRAERDGEDITRMNDGPEPISCRDIPDARALVVASGGEQLPVP